MLLLIIGKSKVTMYILIILAVPRQDADKQKPRGGRRIFAAQRCAHSVTVYPFGYLRYYEGSHSRSYMLLIASMLLCSRSDVHAISSESGLEQAFFFSFSELRSRKMALGNRVVSHPLQ
jgi:hypothetical protein